MLPPPTAALLSELAALLSPAPIRSFLLHRDPASTLSLVTSPLLTTHAVQTHTQTCVTERSSQSDLLNSTTSTTTLYIPAFSVDSTTLGLAISSTSTNSPYPSLSPPTTLSVSRFARFPNFLVTLSDSTLCHTTLHTTRRKTHSCVTLSSPAESLSLDSLLTSTTKLELERGCPKCSDTSCRCMASHTPPSHALDFSAESANASMFAGSYRGAAVLQYYRDGVPCRNAHLRVGTREHVTSRTDVDNLIAQAVMDALSSHLPMHVVRAAATDYKDEAGEILTRLVGVEEGEDETDGTGRRERNRAAAARSNRRRRYHNRWLRAGVVIYRLRATRLREMEKSLRREQFWLRQRYQRELSDVAVKQQETEIVD